MGEDVLLLYTGGAATVTYNISVPWCNVMS